MDDAPHSRLITVEQALHDRSAVSGALSVVSVLTLPDQAAGEMRGQNLKRMGVVDSMDSIIV